MDCINCFCNKKNPILFSDYFDNKIMKIKIIDVYDGDTVTGIVPVLNGKFKFKCRLYGFDSPEKKPPLSNKDRDFEKYCADIAKFALSEKILHKTIKCKTYKLDKYGRLLIEPFDKRGNSITDYMIENNCGYEYFGNTKQKIEYLKDGNFIINNKQKEINRSIIYRYNQIKS